MEVLCGFRQIGRLGGMQKHPIPFGVGDHLSSILSMASLQYYDFIYFNYTFKLNEKESKVFGR